MKDKAWDDELLAEHRGYIRSVEARAAFDVLVAEAIQLPGYNCRPNNTKSPKKDFAYDDAVSGERPFAFIVNRNDLLFYVRQAGLTRVPGGIAHLRDLFPQAAENNSGEWTIHIGVSNDARRLTSFLFGEVRQE